MIKPDDWHTSRTSARKQAIHNNTMKRRNFHFELTAIVIRHSSPNISNSPSIVGMSYIKVLRVQTEVHSYENRLTLKRETNMRQVNVGVDDKSTPIWVCL